MATVNYSTTNFGGLGAARTIVKWSGVTMDDVGQPYDMGDKFPYSVTIERTTASGDAEINIKGSNKDSSPSTGASVGNVTDGGAILHFTNRAARWYWPVPSGDTGNTFNVYLLVGPAPLLDL